MVIKPLLVKEGYVFGRTTTTFRIARALYHDPDILVFDEATSALDSETEKSVMESINSLELNKTIILIAHRVTTLQGCDRIIQLEAGNVVYDGKLEDLDFK